MVTKNSSGIECRRVFSDSLLKLRASWWTFHKQFVFKNISVPIILFIAYLIPALSSLIFFSHKSCSEIEKNCFPEVWSLSVTFFLLALSNWLCLVMFPGCWLSSLWLLNIEADASWLRWLEFKEKCNTSVLIFFAAQTNYREQFWPV